MIPLALGCAPSSRPAGPEPATPRAILVSFDAMNEERARRTVDPSAIPTLLAFFNEASCADGARPMWPSLTAASHAALWTGAYGDVNGVVANTMTPLPWSQFSLVETASGFDARQLRAEPIWIAAIRQGKRVVAHHVTQVGYPGRWRPEGGRDTALARRDSTAIGDARAFLINGYTGGAEPRLLTGSRNPLHPAPAWTGVSAPGAREASWTIGRDSVFALFGAGPEVLVNRIRDAATAVRVRPAPPEQAPLEGRALARYFSEVLWFPEPGGRRSGVYFRLWKVAPDRADYELYQSGRSVTWTNQPQVIAGYEAVVGGFVGNTAWNLMRDAGPPIERGGDGTAELKYLETAELETRQFMRGSEWTWKIRNPELQVDYFSLADDLDHSWYGLVAGPAPGVSEEAARKITAMRSRGWALVDRRLAALRALARESGALLVVSGDHGMRPIGRLFHVNSVLRNAGLLVADSAGRPDLSRTRAISNGYFVTVNRIGRKGGIVPPERVNRIVDSVIAALRQARGPDGSAIVTEIRRPAIPDPLGLGGPAGGDVYFGLAPGYYYSSALNDSISTGRSPFANHGFPSTDPDMQTVLCAEGPGIGGRRLPPARVIDAAPTVSAWLGIRPPADARGRSLLEAMRRR
jgi:hypothetical protein